MLGFLLFAASLANRLASVGAPTSVPSILVVLTGGLVIALWLADSGLGIVKRCDGRPSFVGRARDAMPAGGRLGGDNCDQLGACTIAKLSPEAPQPPHPNLRPRCRQG